jgi:hypothetical protein
MVNRIFAKKLWNNMFRKRTKKQPLFIRTLQWAYDKESVGFKLDELKKAVTSNEEEWMWVKRMMLGEINGDPPLIAHLGSYHTSDGEYSYFITSSGAFALMDYLELKEARESSALAMFVAVGSLIIATIVGIAQIVVQIWF